MAVNKGQSQNAVGTGRRFAIGANVALSIIVAAGLLIAVNVLASYEHVRKDLASVNNYGLSDRTRHILDEASSEIDLSIVYEPNDKDVKQREYIDRLQDYCDELAQYSKQVKVTHVATDRQREQLVADIRKSVGGEAGKHREAIEAFQRLASDIQAELTQRLAEVSAIRSNPDAWLSGFPLFEQVVQKLQEMHDDVGDLTKKINDLTPQAGLPKYGEAADAAKKGVETLKTDFEQVAKLMDRFTSLAKETTQPDSQYISMLRDVAKKVQGIATKLRDAVGAEDAPAPDDLKAPLKDFADACTEVAGTIDGLVSRVDRFSDAFPIVTQHADWSARVQSGPLALRIEVSGVLRDVGRSLEKMRLQVLGILDKNNPDDLKAALVGLRRNTTSIEQNISVCEDILTSLAGSLSTMDPKSKALLEASRNGGLFASTLKSIVDVKKQLDDLPALTLGDIADKLRKPNTVVVQTGKKIRVIPFDDVWPIRGNMPKVDNEEPPRTFNGDSAISSAILTLTADKKFANVVFVGYEPPAPQQRSPFMPQPPRSSIPLAKTSKARERLIAANYNAYQWNMAQEPKAPEMEKGLKTIYVFLPPAPPSPPSPFGQQAPQKKFGEPELAKVRDVLANDGRAIFLTGWEVMSSPFGGPPTVPDYGYNSILETQFGLHVDNGMRVLKVTPSTKTERGFTISPQDIQWMPVIGYTDDPIGKSMRGTRSLEQNVCVVDIRDPADKAKVECNTVLRIPAREAYVGTPPGELTKIVAAINNPRGNGIIQSPERPTATVDTRVDADDHGELSVKLGFVPPLDVNSALLTIDGYTFRAPIDATKSHWIEIPASAVSAAGVSAGDKVDLKLTMPRTRSHPQASDKTIQVTLEQMPAYRIEVPGATVQKVAGYVRDDEVPVSVNVQGQSFDASLRTANGDSWIPLSDAQRSSAGLKEGAAASVKMRIKGVHDRYFPEMKFTGPVSKVDAPSYRAQLTFDPMAGAMLPNQVLKASIKDHAFDATPVSVGGEYRVPIYHYQASKIPVKAGDKVTASVALITGETPSPFNLVVTATRTEPKKASSNDDKSADATTQDSKKADQPDVTKVVVMSTGQSFLDDFVENKVVASFEPLRLDPPPSENLDLLANTVNWLNGTPEYIARGPVPVPRIGAISSGEQQTIRVLLLGAWPALVLGIGLVLWFLRRR